MNRIIFIMAGLFLLLAPTVFGNNYLYGKIMLGGYMSHSIGMGGDIFDETYNVKRKARFGLGGTIHYGWTNRMFLGAELAYQNYKFGNESENEIRLLANFLFTVSHTDKQAIFLNFGGGIYGGPYSGLVPGQGFFLGAVYGKNVSKVIRINVIPRLHIIFDGYDQRSNSLFQIAIAIDYTIG